VVQLFLRLPTADIHADDTVRALSRVMVSAQLDRDCANAQIARDSEDPSVLIYIEDWPDKQRLDDRIRSDRFSALLGLMETCPTRPTLELRFMSEVKGLDYVASVRHVQ